MTVTIPGSNTITGKPETILRLMQDARFFDNPKGDDYIETIKADVKRLLDIDLRVNGSTFAKRAESLLRELARNHIIIIEEDKK